MKSLSRDLNAKHDIGNLCIWSIVSSADFDHQLRL